MGLGFPVFFLKKPDLTEPDRFEPVSGSVRLIFYKQIIIRFGWFFESKPNRTVNTPNSSTCKQNQPDLGGDIVVFFSKMYW
jgi:hypothetical protein